MFFLYCVEKSQWTSIDLSFSTAYLFCADVAPFVYKEKLFITAIQLIHGVLYSM